MVDKRKFLFDQTDTLCPITFDGHSRFRDIIIEVGPFRCSPVNFGIFDISLGRDIRCSESEGILFVRGFYEGEKNRRVGGEEIFNSREYKRDVMISARRIQLIQRNLCSINLYEGFSFVENNFSFFFQKIFNFS